MLKQILAGGLSAALTLSLLTGCSAPATSSSNSTDNGTGIPAAAQEDVDSYLTNGAVSCKDTAMTVNGNDVPAGAYFYWLSYYASYLKYYYESSGGEDAFSLDKPYGDTTYGAYVQKETEQTIVDEVIAAQQAQERNIKLSDEAMKTLEDFNDTSDPNTMLYYATDVEGQRFVFTNYNYTDALKNSLFAKGGEYAPNKKTLADFRKDNVFGAKHILMMTSGMDEAEKKKVRTTMQGYLDEILKSEDKVSTFDQIMNEKSEDTGLAQYPDGYTFMTGDMVTEFEDAVTGMKVGDITPQLVESTYGYHIIMRIEPDEKALDNDALLQRYKDTTFDALMKQWSEDATISTSDAVKQLNLNGFFGKLTELQGTIDAINLAKAQADASTNVSADDADPAIVSAS